MRIWAGLVHPLWLVPALALTVVLLVVHGVLPQAPTPLGHDPFALSAWRTATATTVPAGSLWARLGLFDLARSPWLQPLLALPALGLILRLSERLRLAWTTRRLAPPTQALPLTVIRDETIILTGPTPSLAERMATWPGRAYLETGADGLEQWQGDRHQRWTWTAACLEAGGLLLVAALWLNLRLGWQVDGLVLEPGAEVSPISVSHLRLSLDPQATTLTLCCPSATASITARRLGRPTLWVRVGPVYPALTLTATAAGEPLLLQAVEQGGAATTTLTLRFPQERAERGVAVPARNWFLRLVALDDETYSLQVVDAANNLLLTETLTGATALAVADVTLQLQPTRAVAAAVVARPGVILLAPALILLIVGGVARARFPYLRLGLRRNAHGLALRWQGQHGARPTPSACRQLVTSDGASPATRV
ncbi:MAG: hypothetical protein RMN24_08790 [Anaerolineae bacterium]|nr:hypothetical protein [Anaerolineae bacterium]